MVPRNIKMNCTFMPAAAGRIAERILVAPGLLSKQTAGRCTWVQIKFGACRHRYVMLSTRIVRYSISIAVPHTKAVPVGLAPGIVRSWCHFPSFETGRTGFFASAFSILA